MGKIKFFDFSSVINRISYIKISIILFFAILIRVNQLVNIVEIPISESENINKIVSFFQGLSNFDVLGVNVLTLIILILSLILFYKFRLDSKEGLLIIKHSSMNPMNFTIESNSLTDYKVKELQLLQNDLMNTEHFLSENVIESIKRQKDYVSEICSYVNKGYQLSYLGIAHTPLIFLLGFDIGDENAVKYFHKRRDSEENKNFKLLEQYTNYAPLICEYSDSNENDLTGLILCVETTINITNDELSCLKSENDSVLRFYLSHPGFDAIHAENQIIDYVSEIKDKVKEICKKNKIQKIKICLSTSSVFTFALARSFSKVHDPLIEVYHFDMNSEVKYPWGINVHTGEVLVIKCDKYREST